MKKKNFNIYNSKRIYIPEIYSLKKSNPIKNYNNDYINKNMMFENRIKISSFNQ